MAVLPLPLALIACDHAWRDPNSAKWSILGAFSLADAPEFPAQFSEVAVYFALTGAQGRIPIVIQIIDAAEALPEPIASEGFQLEFNGPLAIIEDAIVLHEVIFPFPGEYRLQLLARGNLIIERRIALTNPARE